MGSLCNWLKTPVAAFRYGCSWIQISLAGSQWSPCNKAAAATNQRTGGNKKRGRPSSHPLACATYEGTTALSSTVVGQVPICNLLSINYALSLIERDLGLIEKWGWREHHYHYHCHALGDEIQRVPSLFTAQAGGSVSSLSSASFAVAKAFVHSSKRIHQ